MKPRPHSNRRPGPGAPQPAPSRASALAAALLSALLLAPAAAPAARAQSGGDLERDRNRGRAMLKLVKDYIKEYYYDPSYRGIDVEARFKTAEAKIGEAQSLSQVLGVIAQAVSELNDSHTFFIPPPRPVEVHYGWKMQMIGDTPYVVSVKPGSDAEAQGLKPGDEVLSVDGFRPTRQTFWKMEYSYRVLRPQPGKRVVVSTPDGERRELAVKAKVEKESKSVNFVEILNEMYEEEEDAKKLPRFYELGEGAEGVFVWRLREFGLTESKIDDMMKRARQRKSLVLDLRGNGGGYVKTLQRLVGYFFDREVTVGEMKRRKEAKPLKARTRGADKVFKGQLVVLVDSESGSAAELFARVVQLEKRGTVVGDRTAGAVMVSTVRPGLLGDSSSSNVIPYGLSVTEADIIMADGKSLEHAGVVPDLLLLPTAEDLRRGHDPVLARAVQLAGGELTPEKAGSLFPPEPER